MYSYASVPIIALFCYSFLLVSFLAARKNKIINSFIGLLVIMIMWTGGSFFMRMGLWPYEKFWFHVSLIGMMMMPVGFLGFIREFMEVKSKYRKGFWSVLVLLIMAVNIKTGVFVDAPQMKEIATGQITYIYDIHWPVVVLFLTEAFILLDCAGMIYKNGRRNAVVRKKLNPILLGIFILFLGHVLLVFPLFKGFPIDLMSGIINAFLMFYALYKKRLFKLTLLISRGNCYALAIVLAVVIFYNLVRPLEELLSGLFHLGDSQRVMAIAVLVMLVTMGMYAILKKFFDELFVKDELVQTENLRDFSAKVSKSLNIQEILTELIEIIQKTISVEKVYICIQDDQGEYKMVQSTSPLNRRDFVLAKDHPVVEYLKKSDGCLLMREFKRTVAYKSMWEEEKHQLAVWKIECFVALKDEEDIIGIVMLSNKLKHERYTYNDISFLTSVDSVSSIAVKNSRLYEKAYEEARKDELTGLLNRKCFYEVLDEAYERFKDSSLALIILNIDDFKLYNQLYGDQEGDIALQKVAAIIQASAGEKSYVARYSGKEFAIILPQYDLHMAKKLAENIAAQIRDMNRHSKEYALKALTVSCGICGIPFSASNPHELVNNADMAVYHVKRSGKNAVMIYSVGQDQKFAMQVPEPAYKKSVYSEYASTIYALTAAIDTKDHYTFSHSKNVAYYASELAKAYGMNQECVNIVHEAGLLHDIGKIGIPEDILNKPGKLTDEEYEVMKGHVEHSIGIIRHLPSLDYVIPAVIGHHERYDGRGYPRRIAGEDIPIMARMLCVADSFDAMISKRSYKPSMEVDKALGILEEEAGMQFDPKLVPIFIDLVKRQVIEIQLN